MSPNWNGILCEYIFAIVFILWLLNSININHLPNVRYLQEFRNTLLINFAMGKWWQCSWRNLTCSYTRVSTNPSPDEAHGLISPKIPCVFRLHQNWVSAMVLSRPLLPSYVLGTELSLSKPRDSMGSQESVFFCWTDQHSAEATPAPWCVYIEKLPPSAPLWKR